MLVEIVLNYTCYNYVGIIIMLWQVTSAKDQQLPALLYDGVYLSITSVCLCLYNVSVATWHACNHTLGSLEIGKSGKYTKTTLD